MNAETRIAFLVLGLAAVGCSTEAENTPAPPPAVRIGTENVLTVSTGTIVVGPIISGELRAEREATVRVNRAARPQVHWQEPPHHEGTSSGG